VTDETKKPSEQISEMRERIAADVMFTPRFDLLSGLGQSHASLTAVVHYLDAEHERRAKFEADVLERIGALEAIAKPLRFVVAPKDISQVEREKLAQEVNKLGATVLPYGSSVPVGVYAGDGHPRARGYEPTEETEEP